MTKDQLLKESEAALKLAHIHEINDISPVWPLLESIAKSQLIIAKTLCSMNLKGAEQQ